MERARPAVGSAAAPVMGRGRAYAFGRLAFLALIALTPLVIGALPPQVGTLAQFRFFDPAGLPKLVTLVALSGAAFAGWGVSLLRHEAEVRWHPLMWVAVALLGWAGVSTVFSRSPALSVLGAYHQDEGLTAFVAYMLVAFLAIQFVRSTRDLRTVAATAAVAGSLVALYAVLQSVGVDPFAWVNDTGRVFSTMGNADSLGTYLVFPLALAIGLALSTPRGWRACAWWASAAFIAAALIASATRGAWIGALVMLMCIVAVRWGGAWKSSRRTKIAIAGGAFVLLAAAAVAIVAIRPRMAASASTLASALTSLSNGRTVIWGTGLRAWLTDPVLGWGPGGFGHAFQSAVGADWFAIVEGLQTTENAHGFLVQALVTLGIPGLFLTVWAYVSAARASLRGMAAAKGTGRTLLVAVWGGFVGLVVALLFGVTVPAVSVWVWLAIGMLLAPLASTARVPARAWSACAVAAGLALVVWAGTWTVADVMVGQAMELAPGPAQVSELEGSVAWNPLAANYRWLVADALVAQAVADQKAGAGAAAVDATIVRALDAYAAAADADRGDALVRAAYANTLVGYAVQHPGSDAAARAVAVAQEAVRLAPGNPAVLAALARAYQVAGRHDEAVATARLAREVAPEYAAQTLGSLGETVTVTP
jgi:O-antigen ligase